MSIKNVTKGVQGNIHIYIYIAYFTKKQMNK